MPNDAPVQESKSFSASQEIRIKQLASDEINKVANESHKNTTIIVTTCILVSIAIVFFSLFYIAQLKHNILLNFEDVVKDIGVTSSDSIHNTAPSSPTDTVIDRTVTVQLESANLLSADYLAIVLPILISLTGAYIVFLGMNRLKMFDERIDSTRTHLMQELGTMVKSQVVANQEDYTRAMKQTLKNQLDEVNINLLKIQETELSLKTQAEKYINEINNNGKQYDWLKSFVDQKLDYSKIDNIHTIFDAHKLVELLRQDKSTNPVPLIQEIVNRVVSSDLSGDPADYHNLSAELERGSMYTESSKVLKKGLMVFPNDTDLLADWINNATTAGNYADAAEALECLNKIDTRLWTWRCYVFSCDYYRAVGKLDQALNVCNKCIDNLPTDQHGYMKKAEITRMVTPGMHGIRDSITILSSALELNIACAQCSTQLGKTYMELGEYEKALEAFNRAVIDLAQPQPGVNESYVFYHRASCYDRLFTKSMNTGKVDSELLYNAYADYVTSLQLGGLATITATQTTNRLHFFKRYLSENTET